MGSISDTAISLNASTGRTRARRDAGRAGGLLLLAVTGLLPGCRREAEPLFSVMTYNAGAYGLEDRDADGQRNNPKPEAERKAVAAVIAAQQPDVVALQEIGREEDLERLRADLAGLGLVYPHAMLIPHGDEGRRLALLSRLPLTGLRALTNDWYSMGPERVPVTRGFLEAEVQLGTGPSLLLLVAHLKSKAYHPYGQTEMRRNEARLLRNHIRAALAEDPDRLLLVAGTLHDHFGSAALRELLSRDDRPLFDLRPADEDGTVWTHFDREDDSYRRIDYLLASPRLTALCVREGTRISRHPLVPQASPHRPLTAAFRLPEDGRR